MFVLKRMYLLQFGTLKDIRIVTHKNGISKGIAYVEFADAVRFFATSFIIRFFEPGTVFDSSFYNYHSKYSRSVRDVSFLIHFFL